jgi:hypothetical protein
VFGRDVVRTGASAKAWRCLVVSGAADPSYDAPGTQAVLDAAAKGSDELVLLGADHSLVVRGDLAATVDGWRRLADAVVAFSTA